VTKGRIRDLSSPEKKPEFLPCRGHTQKIRRRRVHEFKGSLLKGAREKKSGRAQVYESVTMTLLGQA